MSQADETPSEPTTTLVLSSPGGLFVDVRVHDGHSDGTFTKPKVLSTAAQLLRTTTVARPRAYTGLTAVHEGALDWAFAGTATRTVDEGGVARGRWTHVVDSRLPLGESGAFVDEGEMEERVEEGGEKVEVERGSMARPETGVVTPYEEGWAEVVREEGGRGTRDCVVLGRGFGAGEEGASVKGLVVRVGPWCQGIVRDGERVRVERWLSVGGGSGAQALFSSGEGVLPCREAMSGTFTPGQTLDGERWDGWKVLEVALEEGTDGI